ncbi:hypothetical protein [Bradyrhizobium jicamae]|uniref:glycosyltransferase n=1 Tax=Bradyrhizobium jicamae TaxID=280332 RepID=UPI001BAC98CB|nr:hypothetical protein [Bradyrhizobium jicamae]MBR0937880.1 hypothetical protein [Bradyrhizobium jicamae]
MRSVGFGLRHQWNYDVLHFYFGQTFLSPGFPLSENAALNKFLSYLTTSDLRAARRLGKKLFMTLQGCDVRLAKEGNARNAWTMCAPEHCDMYQRCVDILDNRRRYLVNEVLPLFDHVFYLNPELGHAVPNGQFLPYANVEIEKFAVEPPSRFGKPRIVHAPSNASIKGTPMILEALRQLQSSHDFELILVEKKTHEEALALYRSADLAIDQVLAGWYGGFAVETMAMGKPVACYIRDNDLRFVPEAMRREMPIFHVTPANLVKDLGAILDRRSEWEARGQDGRRYVKRWHNPEHIAKAMLRAYAARDNGFQLEPDNT